MDPIAEQYIDILYEIPYFRKLLEDFSGEKRRENLYSSFSNKIIGDRIYLDKHLTIKRNHKTTIFVGNTIIAQYIGNNVIAVLLCLLGLLQKKNYTVIGDLSFDSEVCEFLREADLFSGEIFSTSDDELYDTHEHLVLKERPPRCYNFRSAHRFRAYESVELVVVESPRPQLLVEYCQNNNRGFMVYCDPKIRHMLETPGVVFVGSSDPRQVFPATSTKNARSD